ncbi:MAG: TolC family protein [Verrucomicrobiota bacterium]
MLSFLDIVRSFGAVAMLALFLCSCTAQKYRERADLETRAILFSKTEDVENVENETVELESSEPWQPAERNTATSYASFLGDRGKVEQGARIITLSDCLDTAIHQNRDYLTETEAVFTEALDLTLTQHRLAPIFGAGSSSTRRSDSRNARVTSGVNNIVASNTFSHNQAATFDMLYRTGARLSTAFTQDFLNFMMGNRDINSSALAVSLVQPLLQGGGTATTLEALTQADRELLYTMRDFANFRRAFVVEIVSDYYGVLQARDRVKNAHAAYTGFLKNVEREKALGEEGWRTQTQVGQLRQALLQSETSWLNAVRDYETRLDSFKIQMGIPVDQVIILDESELDKLKIVNPKITRDESVKIAMVTRPDLATSKDRIEDAGRKIKVAENGLKPGLDVKVEYEVVSDPGSSASLNFDRRNLSAGLDLDLPLDRKAERNLYRTTLITRDQRERRHLENIDRVKLQIYDDWRALDLAKKNYEIANMGVDLAQRRLEEQYLLSELGKGEARDLVDAQNDLLNALNQRTSTTVAHTLARLRLWRDMGILYVNEDGSWVEKLKREGQNTSS